MALDAFLGEDVQALFRVVEQMGAAAKSDQLGSSLFQGVGSADDATTTAQPEAGDPMPPPWKKAYRQASSSQASTSQASSSQATQSCGPAPATAARTKAPPIEGAVTKAQPAIRAKAKAASVPVTPELLAYYSAERQAAEAAGLKWQARGPPGPADGGPEEWRGQQWRPGSQRWSNRGGTHSQWYSHYHFLKRQGFSIDDAKKGADERFPKATSQASSSLAQTDY